MYSNNLKDQLKNLKFESWRVRNSIFELQKAISALTEIRTNKTNKK